jgi:hypothetical protein
MLLRSLVLLLSISFLYSAEMIPEKERVSFTHFFLKQFTSQTPLSEDVFQSNDIFHMSLFPEDRMLKSFLHKDMIGNYLPATEMEQKFFLEYREERSFPEIRLARKYYYDSYSRTFNKIGVFLFGTLWLPEVRDSLKTMKDLYEGYSKEEQNQQSLVSQFQDWFKDKIQVGFTPGSLAALNKEEKLYKSFPDKYREKMRRIYSFSYGGLYFWPLPLVRQFQWVRDIYEQLSIVKYRNDITFSFVVTAARAPDGQAFVKDNNIPFPVLDDYAAEVSDSYIQDRIPIVVIVDEKGRIAYHGEVLSYLAMKAMLDRLLVDVFNTEGQRVKEMYHQKRVLEFKKQQEEELRKKRVEEAERKLQEKKEQEAKKSPFRP